MYGDISLSSEPKIPMMFAISINFVVRAGFSTAKLRSQCHLAVIQLCPMMYNFFLDLGEGGAHIVGHRAVFGDGYANNL
jgi:hypothetical protein